MEEAPPIVELAGVTQSYGAFTAIEDVSMRIADGEYLALLGPSGCGKSTLLRIAIGLQTPTRGKVLYRGAPLVGVNSKAAVVFQTFALFPWLTVQQNVEVALKPRGYDAAERALRATAALHRVGLDGFETALPRELSGGMRQKAGFARAIAVEPELLCLDEPFSALDVLSAETLRGELLELWTSGKLPMRAVLMVTHNIEEGVLMADRIVVMQKQPGRIVAELRVDLPRPRSRRDPHFVAMVDRVYELLAGQTSPEHAEPSAAADDEGATRALPHITVDALMGLIEHLAERPGHKEDIFRLAIDLHVDSEHLLDLTDGAAVLGLATVAEGDVQLQPLGAELAAADIGPRKLLLAQRIARLPMVRWLLRLLRASEGGAIERRVGEAALSLELSTKDAHKQMDTLIRFGRYAGLFDYDDRRARLLLTPGDQPASQRR
jgi:NitT/TauT family transport system ATP-binding protein